MKVCSAQQTPSQRRMPEDFSRPDPTETLRGSLPQPACAAPLTNRVERVLGVGHLRAIPFNLLPSAASARRSCRGDRCMTCRASLPRMTDRIFAAPEAAA